MKRRISLAHFTNSLQRGGAEEHLLTLVRGLDPERFRLSVVCPPPLAERIESDLPAGVELIRLQVRRPGDISSALRLARVIRQRQVDILHSHLFYSSLFASPVGWLCRVPAIIETPHLREQWRHGWLKGRYFIDRGIGRLVDYFVAVSEANARYLIQEKGLPARKIVVIRNGCDVRRFGVDRPAPLGMKNDLKFGESDPVLVTVARLEPQKGHAVLLEALGLVRQRFPNARWVAVGEGSLRSHLETLAREKGLEDRVRFVGYQTHVEDWLALADLTVLPSYYEGLPLAAIESLAAARPMVATSVDGTPEIVRDGQTGLLVPPGDAVRLAEAICRLLGDPGLREKHARAGRLWVLEHFSQENQIRRTQELYRRALEDRAAVRCREEGLGELGHGRLGPTIRAASQTDGEVKL